jgi:hypothetical protein
MTDPSHSIAQHSFENDAIVALETKLGINGSAVTTSIDWILKNSGSVNPGHGHTVLAGVTVSGTPQTNYVLTATGTSTANWQAAQGGGGGGGTVTATSPDSSITIGGSGSDVLTFEAAGTSFSNCWVFFGQSTPSTPTGVESGDTSICFNGTQGSAWSYNGSSWTQEYTWTVASG